MDAAKRRIAGWSSTQRQVALESVEAALCGHDVEGAFRSAIIPDDDRDPWPAFCALVCLIADPDSVLFWQCAADVLHADAQQLRAAAPRGPDALTQLIRQYLAEMPDVLPSELWRDFSDQAETGFSDVLAGFEDGRLRYCRKLGTEPVSIRYNAFRRRVQEIRKAGNLSLKHRPAVTPAGWWEMPSAA